LLLLVGELMVLLVTYRKGDEAIIGMGLSAYVMTMSFAVIGLACDFRYLYFPMVASLVIPIMMAGRTRSHEIAKNIPAKIRPTPTA
jgi:ABC-type sulfate transport system permease subunit